MSYLHKVVSWLEVYSLVYPIVGIDYIDLVTFLTAHVLCCFTNVIIYLKVRSGRLQWSPVHKSDKFWRENAPRFNEKNFELIK